MTGNSFSAEERSYEYSPCAARICHLLWTIVANLAGRPVRQQMLGVGIATRKKPAVEPSCAFTQSHFQPDVLVFSM
jgi:hypothetical protein